MSHVLLLFSGATKMYKKYENTKQGVNEDSCHWGS